MHPTTNRKLNDVLAAAIGVADDYSTEGCEFSGVVGEEAMKTLVEALKPFGYVSGINFT